MIQTYFIRNYSDKSVKIGKSDNPSRRLKDLQVSSPNKLKLSFVLDGDREKEFHTQYQHLRKEGEWFNMAEDLRDFVEAQESEISHRQILRENKQGPINGLRLEDTYYGPSNPARMLVCPICRNNVEEHQHPGIPEYDITVEEGVVIRIPFIGECGHSWDFVFKFHKGHTIIDTDCAKENNWLKPHR